MKSDAYESASKLFVVRKFPEAVQVLTASPLGTDTKAWLLYLALCDRAFIEPDNVHWPFNDADRKTLRSEFLKSKLWEDLLTQWEAEDKTVPPSIIQSGFKLARKHKSEPGPIIAFVEALLSQSPLTPDLFESFIIGILVELQRDFYYARELSKRQTSLPEEFKAQLLASIDELESNYKREKEIEQAMLREVEKQRLQQAIAHAENTSVDSDSANDEESSSREVSASSRSIEEPASSRKTRAPRQQRTLLQFWKQWLHDFIRSQGLYNALVVIFMLLAALNNGRFRAFLNRGTRWAWLTLKSSIQMGLSVTYL